VDKPVTTTVEEALELDALAKKNNRILYGYQNRRWDSDYLTLRKLLDEGALGDVLDFESHFDRYKPMAKGTWKDKKLPGNGLVYDLGAHLLDQALQLFGRPEKLTAFVSHIRGLGGPELDDAFTIHLHYPSRTPHPLHVTLCGHLLTVRNPQVRYIVRGTEGTFTKYGVDPQEEQLVGGMKITNELCGVESSDLAGQVQVLGPDGKIGEPRSIQSLKGCYLKLYENLAAAIDTGAELDVKWMQAGQVIELIQLSHESSAQGKTLDVPTMPY